MYDIICPHCGERFIARDVAFDLSKYIWPLLSETEELDSVKDLQFKYYADEEVFRGSDSKNTVPLFCDNDIGPGNSGEYFTYEVTNEMLIEYIQQKITCSLSLNDGLSEINAIKKDKMALDSIKYTQQHIEVITSIYNEIFGCSEDDFSEFSIYNHTVRSVINVLIYMYENIKKCVNIKIRLHSYGLNPKHMNYQVADCIFVKDLSGVMEIIPKCCRSCGASFPRQFGYYRMKPVVLLGSHFSGKTSYLLALLYTVLTKAPFAGHDAIRVNTLDDDVDIAQFEKNIELFQQGKPPIKTDFVNMPIMNLLINDVIYSFIDWPGEKFINDNNTGSSSDMNFILHERRIIARAKHFLCFIEPTQVAQDIPQAEERVVFNLQTMANRFMQHMAYATKKKSVVYIVNKFDIITEATENGKCLNARHLVSVMQNISETDVYSNKEWNNEVFENIDRETKDFIRAQSISFVNAIDKTSQNVTASYVPCAPYGRQHAGNDSMNAIHFTCLAGIPLLKILKIDNKL